MKSLDILCDVHVIPTIMFLNARGTCGRTEIYQNVSRASNMPRKLDRMESAGLISQTAVHNGKEVGLTRKGRAVASELRMIGEIIAGE